MEHAHLDNLSDKELNSLTEKAWQGGDYEAARGLIERERERRTRIILAMHAVDEAYLIPDDSETIVRGEN